MMNKRIFFPSLIALMVGQSVAVFADVPKAQPLSRYRELWTASRICSPPPPPEVEEPEEVFEDYALLSVTPLGDQYMVSIKHKKNAAEGRIRILPGEVNASGFAVEKVLQTEDYMATKVTLSHKGKSGVVEYDTKHLALKKAPLPAQAKGGKASTSKTRSAPKPPTPGKTSANAARSGLPPGLQAAGLPTSSGANRPASTGSNNPSSSTTRKPRVRRVPTPPSR